MLPVDFNTKKCLSKPCYWSIWKKGCHNFHKLGKTLFKNNPWANRSNRSLHHQSFHRAVGTTISTGCTDAFWRVLTWRRISCGSQSGTSWPSTTAASTSRTKGTCFKWRWSLPTSGPRSSRCPLWTTTSWRSRAGMSKRDPSTTATNTSQDSSPGINHFFRSNNGITMHFHCIMVVANNFTKKGVKWNNFE